MKTVAIRDALFDGDLAALREWSERLVSADPPPETVAGLWFGMFEDARGGFTLYVLGFNEAEAGDFEGDWATQTPSWEPAGRYFRLQSLSAMASGEWEAGLQRALDLLRALAPQEQLTGGVRVIGAGFEGFITSRSSPRGTLPNRRARGDVRRRGE